MISQFFYKNKKIIFIIIFLISVVLTYGFLINLKTRYKISQLKKEQKIREEKIKKEWEKIYQTKNNIKEKPTSQPEEKIIAKGEFIFNIILTKPDSLSTHAIDPFLKTFFSEKKYYSLNYVKEFYQKEANKYAVKNFDLKINHFGPFDIRSLPYIGDVFNPWYKDPFSELKMKDAFNAVIKENNLSFDLSKKNFYIFVYFDPSFEKEEKVKDYSFYDYKKFRSFADSYNQKAYINVYDFSPKFSKKLVTIILHESFHLFGATDKYNEDIKNDRFCSEKGRGVVNNLVYLPQDTGDIMCLYVEYEQGKFRQGDLEKEELVVNEITAKEIGWINY
jgi:hypothetical protein